MSEDILAERIRKMVQTIVESFSNDKIDDLSDDEIMVTVEEIMNDCGLRFITYLTE